MYGLSDSTKFPASGMATVSEPMLVSQVGRVREVSRSENNVLTMPLRFTAFFIYECRSLSEYLSKRVE
jgi:hypothetical protein